MTSSEIKLSIITNDIRKVEFVSEMSKQGVKVTELRGGRWSVYSEIKKVDIVQATLYEERDFPKVLYRFLLAKFLRRQTVRLWVGTDVLLSLQQQKEQFLSKVLDRLTDSNIVVSENLCEELQQIHIRAEFLPQPFCNAQEVAPLPMPDRFTVLSYLPDTRKEFYGYPIIRGLAEEFPDIQFIVVGGNGGTDEGLSNLQYVGITNDMEIIYKKTSLLVRITGHDGLPRMVIEAMLRGRNIIWNQKFPFCHYAEKYSQVRELVVHFMNNTDMNYDGAAFVKENFDDNMNGNGLAAHYRKMINRAGLRE